MHLLNPDQQCSTGPTPMSLRAPPLVPLATATVVNTANATTADAIIDNGFVDIRPFLP